jgi:hypothetical protein
LQASAGQEHNMRRNLLRESRIACIGRLESELLHLRRMSIATNTNLQIVKPSMAIIFSELGTLLDGEQRLNHLYSQLGTRPHLREYFLRQLAELQERADGLDSMLGTPLTPASQEFDGLVA